MRDDPRSRAARACLWPHLARFFTPRVVFFGVNAQLDYDYNLFSVSDEQLLASLPIDFVRCSSAPFLACPPAYTNKNAALFEGGISSISAVLATDSVNYFGG